MVEAQGGAGWMDLVGMQLLLTGRDPGAWDCRLYALSNTQRCERWNGMERGERGVSRYVRRLSTASVMVVSSEVRGDALSADILL